MFVMLLLLSGAKIRIEICEIGAHVRQINTTTTFKLT